MKWFKHYNNARNKEALIELRALLGEHVGYACYFFFVEYCHSVWNEKKEPFFKLSPKNLRKILELSPKNCEKFLRIMAKVNNISYTFISDFYEIYFNKLPEILDKDTKYNRNRIVSSDCSAFVKIAIDKDKDKDKDQDKDKDINTLMQSDEIAAMCQDELIPIADDVKISKDSPKKYSSKFPEYYETWNNFVNDMKNKYQITLAPVFAKNKVRDKNIERQIKEFGLVLGAYEEALKCAEEMRDFYLRKGFFNFDWLFRHKNQRGEPVCNWQNLIERAVNKK